MTKEDFDSREVVWIEARTEVVYDRTKSLRAGEYQDFETLTIGSADDDRTESL